MLTIKKTRIIGTKIVVFSAWEPYAQHGTLTYTDDSNCLGRVGTAELPAELNALRGEERYSRVKAWHAAEYERAYAAIVEQYPEAINGTPSMGEIEIHLG